MIPASTEDPLEVFIRFTRDWFRLLAQGEFAQAIALLDEPNNYGVRWDETELWRVLSEYAGTENARVTDPDALAGTGRPNLVEYADKTGFSFQHDVPLDGRWSGLTADFEFLNRSDGCTVMLKDIHVL